MNMTKIIEKENGEENAADIDTYTKKSFHNYISLINFHKFIQR